MIFTRYLASSGVARASNPRNRAAFLAGPRAAAISPKVFSASETLSAGELWW